MNSHNVSEVAQIVTALTMLTSFFTALSKGGKWLLKLVEATEANTRALANLSVRTAAMEAKLGMPNVLTTVNVPGTAPEPSRHDTPNTI